MGLTFASCLRWKKLDFTTKLICLSNLREVIAAEGDSVTLNCSFGKTATHAYLFWYKQEVNNLPKYMLKRGTYSNRENTEEFHEDKFDAELDKTNSLVPLKIQKLNVTDSAVYYCAISSLPLTM
uniref:Ig-like domain-containing protein n=1 Tax=Oryzias melastigma TaxID=30732 RepID=A0A3B3C9Z8_ORYME